MNTQEKLTGLESFNTKLTADIMVSEEANSKLRSELKEEKRARKELERELRETKEQVCVPVYSSKKQLIVIGSLPRVMVSRIVMQTSPNRISDGFGSSRLLWRVNKVAFPSWKLPEPN